MFIEYQTEIIALIAILTLLVIYILIKRKTPHVDDAKEKILQEIEIQEQNTTSQAGDEEPKEEDEEPKEEELEEVLEGSEEGDFGVEEQPKEEEPPREYSRKSDIRKRDVPHHAKITKEKFKEFSGIRVLVAEDNLINQKVISGLLAESGIELTIANDGQEVLDILEKDDDFLMILMDAHMPRVDGFEATRKIRENSQYDHIVVVALSGDTAADDIRKMSEAGMAEHLEKPLRMDSLYDVFYAYTGAKEQDKDDEEYVEVVMTKELNGDRGLFICGGDEQFYLEILHEFIDTYSDSAQRLRELLLQSQFQTADRLLLDIVGVSANIGAEKLTDIANNFKDTLKDTKDKSYFTILEQYQAHLEVLLGDIHEYIDQK
jgi:CheY-like chemotaxis protein